MIDLSNVTAIALGADEVLEIQDSLGTVLWQKTIYYNVNISAGNNGSVTVNSVAGNYSATVPAGTTLTLVATPDSNYQFNGWSDGDNNTTRTITVTGDITLTASFTAIMYNVSISAGNNGSVSVNGVAGNYSQSVPAGTVLTIEGTGNTGYDFDEWSDGNTDNPRTITVNSDITLTAAFEEVVVLPNYFYVEDVSGSDNTLSITKNNASAPTIEVFKSTDRINWTTMGTTSTTAITATVPANGKLYLKCTTNAWGNVNKQASQFTCSGNYNIGGNVMSLLNGENFEGTIFNTSTNVHAFRQTFNDSNLISASNLLLPSNTTSNCYRAMFSHATSLTGAPVLPATQMNIDSYAYMFEGCTSLTTAPALPATELFSECYLAMFKDCTSLTTAPSLPAINVSAACYKSMFKGCTALTTPPALPATRLYNQCYNEMFYGCTSLTAAPALPATTLSSECYRNMFNGCTSLTTAPALPATTLANSCYYSMFQNCTALTTAPVLPAITLVNECYRNMFNTCTSLNSVTSYAQNISAGGCLYNWLYNVAATGQFYNLGGATYPRQSSGIPTGWTEHTTL